METKSTFVISSSIKVLNKYDENNNNLSYNLLQNQMALIESTQFYIFSKILKKTKQQF